MKPMCLLALASVCGALALPAQAFSGADARVDKLRFTLEDLAPDDGVTPSVSLIPGAGYSYASTGALWQSQDGIFKTVGVSYADPSALASAAIDAASLTVKGRAGAPYALFEAEAFTGTIGYEFRDFTFSLYVPAHSRLTISADLFLSAFAGNGVCISADCAPSESAWAQGWLWSFYADDAVGISSEGRLRDATLEAQAKGGRWEAGEYVGSVDEDKTLSTVLYQTFVNVGDQSEQVSLRLGVRVGGSSMTSPVPEPGAWLLAGSGLALLAWRRHTGVLRKG